MYRNPTIKCHALSKATSSWATGLKNTALRQFYPVIRRQPLEVTDLHPFLLIPYLISLGNYVTWRNCSDFLEP